jgi:hypothetical protein
MKRFWFLFANAFRASGGNNETLYNSVADKVRQGKKIYASSLG